MMVRPVKLLIYLWWCSHVDSWHVVFWFAYISDLEFWSAFVWSIILVLLHQHSFGDAWTCFSICSLRLCICFFIASSLGISQSVLFGDILCLMLVTILHWGIPPILEFIRSFAYFLTTWSISWSLRVVTLVRTPFSDFLLGHTPSLWVYHVSCWFHGYQTHLLIFMSYYLGHPPTISLFRASPYCHFIWGIPLLSFRLGHPPAVIYVWGIPHCHLRLGHSPTVISFRASPYFRLV